MTRLIFIDGNPLRAAELGRIAPGLEVTVEALQTGFSTSAPEPAQRARDKVLAHPVGAACFAEAVDLTTMEGKSLRLELDSENENRLCKWWRETPAKMQLVVALRRTPAAEIELRNGRYEARMYDKPGCAHVLGWDRLFVPADTIRHDGSDGPDRDDATLAQLTAGGEVSAFRREVYTAVGRALGAIGS